MDQSTADSLILENMELAERIGQKYASRHSRHVGECVAEAYFWLVLFFREDHRLYYANIEDYKRILGVRIKRELIRYFEKRGYRETVELEDKITKNTDEEMIEFLSGLYGDDGAFKVYKYLRDGISFADIEIVEPQLIKTAKKLRLQVAGRIKRIENLKSLGLPVSREIKYPEDNNDRSMEDGAGGETEGTESHPRERGREVDPGDAQREQDQSETPSSLGY